jgi:hypothetical protein
MVTFDLGSLTRDKELLMARALAIESYARVEQSLSLIFCSLLGTTVEKGAIVFWKLTNARFRNRMIKELLFKVHRNKFDAYWKGSPGQPGVPKTPGLFAMINSLGDQRNHIVHWHIVTNINLIENPTSQEVLSQPHFWDRSANGNQLPFLSLWTLSRRLILFTGRS